VVIDKRNPKGYIANVITSFDHKGLEKFFYDEDKRGIQPAHAQKLADILDRLDASVTVQDMNYPGSNLHQLNGRLKGVWSVKVSGNWRVTFKFTEGNAYVADCRDYH